MELQLTNQTDFQPQTLPAGLADVALIDATKCAAVGDMSVAWWHEEVRAGRAPQPVIRGHRCTRWKLAHVLEFWRRRGEEGHDAEAAAQLTARAKKASTAAQAKRKASPVQLVPASA